ncbi:MAG: PIG-L family deacetylase [Bacteroidales bacterium]|nr:PIG-L family deacetylase [Bacteroidales bacterium]
MKKVLVTSVHPDDETLGCGGTILKHKKAGDEINWLIISGPTEGHPFGFSKELILQRKQEIENVTKLYGFESTIELDFPTQLLHGIDFRVLVNAIDETILNIKPEIIYLINRSDVHSDHKIAFNAIYACTKNFRKPFIEKILMYETLSETEFAPAVRNNAFVPNVFNDITPYLEKKLEIMKLFTTEVMEEPYPRALSTIKALARYRGSRIGVEYAEAFMLLFEKK